jgi:hypothetical protein
MPSYERRRAIMIDVRALVVEPDRIKALQVWDALTDVGARPRVTTSIAEGLETLMEERVDFCVLGRSPQDRERVGQIASILALRGVPFVALVADGQQINGAVAQIDRRLPASAVAEAYQRCFAGRVARRR